MDKEQGNPDHEKWADYKGDCEIEGIHYWMSAWVNVSTRGTKYLGIRFTKKLTRNPHVDAEAT